MKIILANQQILVRKPPLYLKLGNIRISSWRIRLCFKTELMRFLFYIGGVNIV